MPQYEGRLELTWTNKHLRLLAHEDGRYEWVPPTDYRVAEVRLLHDVATIGDCRPNLDRSRDNLLIRGDALHALTSLAELPEFSGRYLGKVKLCYVDPPFNTGQAFAQYDDALEHSVWLTMMRDRLLQVRELLAPDGSVWVHCDDSEQHRLRSVMDEVFGPSSYVATIIWRSSDNSNNDAKKFSTDHNYLVVYALSEDWTSERLEPTPEQASHFANPDNDPRGPWFDGNPLNSPNPRENLKYTIVSPSGVEIPPPPNGWRWSRETLEAKIADGEIRFTPGGTGIRRRTYLNEHRGLPASSLWVDLEETGHNRQAKSELKKLFPGFPTSELFATPKPERLIQRILQVASKPGDIVLDFFVGTGTTAAVAMKMDRAWVGVESSVDTVAIYALPRLRKVVEGQDAGGITKSFNWSGGGGFRVLDVAPSMFEDDHGVVVLSEWATNGALAETTAAQLGYPYADDPPFCGVRGRTRLAVIDGLVNDSVVRLLVDVSTPGERVVVCGTGIDPAARVTLKNLRRGSTLRKIPASILDEYRLPGRHSGLADMVDWVHSVDADLRADGNADKQEPATRR
ncbi:MAG: site-specific DNA-methyltransferase [Actinomycetota bacterium]|nr:site-specific DNA-methyltransferase [Actinomycetota bacterium]